MAKSKLNSLAERGDASLGNIPTMSARRLTSLFKRSGGFVL